MSTLVRRLVLPVALLVVGLPAGIGAVVAMSPAKVLDEGAFSAVSQAPARVQRRAQARWEPVTTVKGTGIGRASFAVADQAIQWKADWRCDSGRIRLDVGGATPGDKPVADGACPGGGEHRATNSGTQALSVTATGAWQVAVSQQVDTALQEPPLPGMTPGALVRTGPVYPIQKTGEGTVSLYRLRTGRLALRFEDFYTTPSPRLQLWLSRDPNPRSTLDARRARHINAGTVRSTMGSYNQMLPAGIDVADFRSAVIWCPTVLIAFSAVALGGP